MTKAKSSHRNRRHVKRATTSSSSLLLKLAGGGAAAVIAVAIVYLALAGGTSAPASGETAALARANSGSEIRILKGSHHTVYHSTASLPTRSLPQAEGRPTLVWFSGTWCEFCERMEPWAHETAAHFSDRIVFVEKSVDHDRDAAARYGIRGTPTFVLIDAAGKAIAQFAYQPSAAAFQAAIDRALKQLPGV